MPGPEDPFVQSFTASAVSLQCSVLVLTLVRLTTSPCVHPECSEASKASPCPCASPVPGSPTQKTTPMQLSFIGASSTSASRPYGDVGIVEVACLKGARCRGRSVGHGGVHRQFIVFASLPVLCCRACCAAVFHDNATSLVASAQGIVSRRFHDGAKLSIRFLPCLYVV